MYRRHAVVKALDCRSHPVWGAWIEIANWIAEGAEIPRRIPYGVRGLKYGNQGIGKSYIIVASRMGCVD